ncbi:Atrial natriuretic peptide receptor 1 [Holothuria leucospilota]|uniref:Atrial natriuretic peptide receptor 1 n=1 Tax=Holothuria leucospilota TaxID=206669 RepID=A0A9Q1C131_HOLLE|nr:Atrial natriuretic peptide receptor 1 [Holothuria leucospilota]
MSKELRIGLLLPEDPLRFSGPGATTNPRYPFFLQMVKPAIDIALETVKESILPNHSITVVSNNTYCNVDATQIVVVDHYFQYFVDVFFGPACEFAAAPVGRFTSHWNVPMLTAGGRAHGFDGFQSMTRVGGSYTKQGKLLVDMSRKFKWQTITFMVHEEKGSYNDFSFACGGIYYQMAVASFNVSHVTFNQNQPEDYEKILTEDVIPKARVAQQDSCYFLGKVRGNLTGTLYIRRQRGDRWETSR